MSEKKAKQDRKLNVMSNDADPNDIAKDMAESIRKMYEDRDKKAMGAKAHLITQLKLTSEKHLDFGSH